MPKSSTAKDTKEVSSAELPDYLAKGWKVLSWGTWTAGAFLVIISKGA